MIVYVITKGDYSDYHICGVALDKERAEIIRKLMTDEWDEANIEEYDTDEYSDFSEGEHYYEVIRHKDDTVTVYCENAYYYDPKYGVKEGISGMHTYVTAKDEEHAIKKALDLFAKYRYRKAEESETD